MYILIFLHYGNPFYENSNCPDDFSFFPLESFQPIYNIPNHLTYVINVLLRKTIIAYEIHLEAADADDHKYAGH